MKDKSMDTKNVERNTKREFHYFVLTDYEREEEYLRNMHQQGWKLVKVTLPGVYHFEKCEPEDVVYRLDFSPDKNGNSQQYFQMYKDYGWEYMQDLNEYSYFRKNADAYNEKNNEIFSDNASRLNMLEKIFKKRMIPVLAIFALIVVPQILNLMFLTPQQTGGFLFFGGFLGFWCLILVAYVWIIGRCAIGFSQLKKKYS